MAIPELATNAQYEFQPGEGCVNRGQCTRLRYCVAQAQGARAKQSTERMIDPEETLDAINHVVRKCSGGSYTPVE